MVQAHAVDLLVAMAAAHDSLQFEDFHRLAEARPAEPEHLGQQDLTELDCAVMVNGLVRADSLPLVFKAIGADSLPRHARVRVRITGVDLLTLDVHASVVARLDEAGTTDEGESGDEGDDEVLDNAGPLTLAIDVNDAEAPAGEAPAA